MKSKFVTLSVVTCGLLLCSACGKANVATDKAVAEKFRLIFDTFIKGFITEYPLGEDYAILIFYTYIVY